MKKNDHLMDLARKLEKVLINNKVEYAAGFAATLCLATICANNLGMAEEDFMRHCKHMFNWDKNELGKTLQ